MKKPITIYTTDYCPYCVKAKRLLDNLSIAYTQIDVTNNESLRKDMVEKAEGRRTVPQIFIGDTPIGGCDDLYALHESGKLSALLQ